jgi:hypothetical protein
MTRARKILFSALVLGAVSLAAGYGTFSAFSGTTSNGANTFSAGTVVVTDNDGGSVMWNVGGSPGAKPGDQQQACIKILYQGSLAATVKLYVSASSGSLGQYLTMTVDKLTYSSNPPSFPSCGSPATTTNIYTGDLGSFTTTYTNFSNGLSSFPGSQTQWNQNDFVYYRFTVTLQNNNNAQGLSVSTTFTWEAQNQ